MIVSFAMVVTMSTSIKANVIWTVSRDVVWTELADGLLTSNLVLRRSKDLNGRETLEEDLSKPEKYLCADVITPAFYIG